MWHGNIVRNMEQGKTEQQNKELNLDDERDICCVGISGCWDFKNCHSVYMLDDCFS